MLRFANYRTVPPGGAYFYTIPETEMHFKEYSFSRLVAHVTEAYMAADVPVPKDLQARIEDFMCRHFPVSFCQGDDEGKPRKKVATLSSIRQATLALAAGNPRTIPGEARRRAAVCSNCPSNNRQMCTSCSGLQAWARKLAGRGIEGLDAALGVCEIDTTALSATVHMTEAPDNEEFPDNCWRKNQHG